MAPDDAASVEATLRDLVAEVRALRADVARLTPPAPTLAEGPVFADEAAELLGISRSSLDRVIRGLPEGQRPAALPTPRATPGRRPRRRYTWIDEGALRAWWEDVTRCPPQSKPARRQSLPRSVRGGVVSDWLALARTAGEGRR